MSEVLRKLDVTRSPSPVSPGVRRLLGVLVLADVGVVAWMVAAGEWFDATSALTRVVTLGGHHLLVLWLAVTGFVLLGVAAAVTGGIVEADRWRTGLIAVACLVSAVALGGLLSVAALTLCVVLAVAVLGRAFVAVRAITWRL